MKQKEKLIQLYKAECLKRRSELSGLQLLCEITVISVNEISVSYEARDVSFTCFDSLDGLVKGRDRVTLFCFFVTSDRLVRNITSGGGKHDITLLVLIPASTLTFFRHPNLLRFTTHLYTATNMYVVIFINRKASHNSAYYKHTKVKLL